MSVIPESHADLLTRPLFAHLATNRADGWPQVNPMWFASRQRAIGCMPAIPVTANGQPAFAFYARDARSVHLPHVLHVLTLTTAGVSRIVSFQDPGLFPLFGSPPAVRAASQRRATAAPGLCGDGLVLAVDCLTVLRPLAGVRRRAGAPRPGRGQLLPAWLSSLPPDGLSAAVGGHSETDTGMTANVPARVDAVAP
jgi:Pyridoxamine 5'-phosphate oxidase